MTCSNNYYKRIVQTVPSKPKNTKTPYRQQKWIDYGSIIWIDYPITWFRVTRNKSMPCPTIVFLHQWQKPRAKIQYYGRIRMTLHNRFRYRVSFLKIKLNGSGFNNVLGHHQNTPFWKVSSIRPITLISLSAIPNPELCI